MYSQFLHLFTLVCLLTQTNAHFNHLGAGESTGAVSGSFFGDLFRAGGRAKFKMADFADSAASKIRSMFHKDAPPSASIGFQTGYVVQATPYGNMQPPVDVSSFGGANTGGGVNGNIGHNIGIAPANSYDSYRPLAPSGNVGISPSGAPSGDDHLEWVSASGERRRLTYEEIVQLIMIVLESSRPPTGTEGHPGAPAAGYSGVSGGGYTGAPAAGYSGVSGGGYAGVPAAGYSGVSGGGYTGTPAVGYSGVSGGSYAGPPAVGHPGAPTGGYVGGSVGLSVGGYSGVPTGGLPGSGPMRDPPRGI